MTVRDDLLDRVARYYGGRLREHGRTARGVDWNSEDSQRRRFVELLDRFELNSPFSIVDYGCGYGELAVHLAQRGLAFTYTGFDIAEEMVAAAREHAAAIPSCTFTTNVADVPVADYAVASGLFNVKLETPPDAWAEYVWDTIRHLDAHSRVAFSFNVLTAHADADRMRPDLFYADPAELLDRCLRNLSRHVALVHDYGLYEFTIVVRGDPTRVAPDHVRIGVPTR